ncbi:hypothetical protein K6V78_00820 [Streptococcus gallolyticus]|nr:hypothetical protein [Streptococcus gallolyticus]MBY5040206.1 hypothetical protein [Streptococcus gallolyticus]
MNVIKWIFSSQDLQLPEEETIIKRSKIVLYALLIFTGAVMLNSLIHSLSGSTTPLLLLLLSTLTFPLFSAVLQYRMLFSNTGLIWMKR